MKETALSLLLQSMGCIPFNIFVNLSKIRCFFFLFFFCSVCFDSNVVIPLTGQDKTNVKKTMKMFEIFRDKVKNRRFKKNGDGTRIRLCTNHKPKVANLFEFRPPSC